MRIYNLSLSRLQDDGDLRQMLRSDLGDGDATVEDLATTILDRVQIMRVFDLIGVTEAVGEIKHELEGRVRETAEEKSVEVLKIANEVSSRGKIRDRVERTEVADSEDEDDDEMLLDTEHSSPWEPTPTPPPAIHRTEPLKVSQSLHHNEHVSVGKISFILIDNLAHVLSPLLKKDHIQGTFSPCSRSLNKQANTIQQTFSPPLTYAPFPT